MKTVQYERVRKAMDRLRRILRHRGARAVLFILVFLALAWPFMAPALYATVEAQCLHLFVVWGLLIVLLFLLGGPSARNQDNSGG